MYDHAQSPRLGQRTAVENPGVLLTTTLLLPEVAYRGQLVYLLDTHRLEVFDGTAWQPAGGGETTNQTFVGPDEPAADREGDFWVNTSDYQLYVWTNGHWTPTSAPEDARWQRTSIALVQALMGYRDIILAHQVLWYDTSAPIAPMARDIWVNVTSNRVYDYIDQAWTEITDPLLTTPLLAAGVSRSILDGIIEVYTDSVEPLGLGPADMGDLWRDLSRHGLILGWNGVQWVELQVTGDQIQDGAVDTQHIADEAVDGAYQIIKGSIVRDALADRVIDGSKVADLSLAVNKFVSLDHHIY